MANDFKSYQKLLNGHVDLQYRIQFRDHQTIETAWKPTGDEEIPYRFIAGAVYDRRDQFLKRIYEPV